MTIPSHWLARPLALHPPHMTELARADVRAAAGMAPSLAGQIAVIPVWGVLADDRHGDTRYGDIEAQLRAALTDDGVSGIAFHVRSPGGTADGMYDLAEAIFAARGIKPMVAVLDGYAYSAGYAIASAADMITVPSIGGVGSVGVYTLHYDFAGMLDQIGVKPTLIKFGAEKAACLPDFPLAESAREALQADVDAMGEMFVSLVARNRGMTEDAVRATQAATYMGQRGVDIGFADAVMSPTQAMAAFIDQVS